NEMRNEQQHISCNLNRTKWVFNIQPGWHKTLKDMQLVKSRQDKFQTKPNLPVQQKVLRSQYWRRTSDTL
ncbi:MAG: hypothetical protein N0E48_27940, partial [Candidatus Thiodiazotropha endolucinida]|nr:hypothetical protein [Candidatus Thiodiazotropha taylori]MCW4347152.1 hypothetical protein [Candidatus Thiodiazotropha endolucinida]